MSEYVGTCDGRPVTAEEAIAMTNWLRLPSGQCIPAQLLFRPANERPLVGMYWEGNTLVCPDWWPRHERQQS